MLQALLNLIKVNHPKTGKPDVILTMVVFVIVVCAIKFLLDGVTLKLFGHVISFGHTDSFSYGSLLSPVLGAHGFIEGKNASTYNSINRVDDPDQGEQ